MKNLIILSICSLWTCAILGQNVERIDKNKPITHDSINKKIPEKGIRVQYNNQHRSSEMKNPIYKVNGVACLSNIEPNNIENIFIVKKDTLVNGKDYYGIVLITLKDKNYKPQPISLEDLKLKYTNLENTPTIFFIDNDLITDHVKDCFVDENNILKILVDKMENPKDDSDLGIVKIISRTEKNIDEDNKIYLR